MTKMNKSNFVNKKRAEMELINMGYIREADMVVCPYCYGEMPFDSSDFDDLLDFEDEEYQCGHCGKNFLVDGDVEFIFYSNSRRLNDEE